MVALVERAVETLDVLVKPGLYLVEILPFLRYLPSWVPGSGFKKAAADMRQHVLAMLNVPYNFTKEEMVLVLVFFYVSCVMRIISILINIHRWFGGRLEM